MTFNKNNKNIDKNQVKEKLQTLELNDFQQELLKYLAENNKNTEEFLNKMNEVQKEKIQEEWIPYLMNNTEEIGNILNWTKTITITDIDQHDNEKLNSFIQNDDGLKYKVNEDVSFALQEFPESIAKGYVFSSPKSPWNWDADKDYEENKMNIERYVLEYSNSDDINPNIIPQFIVYYVIVNNGSNKPNKFFVTARLNSKNKLEFSFLVVGQIHPIVLVKEGIN